MEKLHNQLLVHIATNLAKTLSEQLGQKDVRIEEIYFQISEPPNFDLGHFAFPCFQLAKKLRLAPNIIAQKLQDMTTPDELVREVKAMGPYLNISLNIDMIGSTVISEILSRDFFRKELIKSPPKTMFEYSQPNTHKELHVGHMRNLCLGNSLVHLYQYTGHSVVSSTYPGDVGTHVAKCLWYLKFHNQERPPEGDKGSWLGAIYAQASKKLQDERGTDAEDGNRQELTNILKQLEAKNGDYYDLWKETREWSIKLINEVYSWADVTFDRWYFESEVDSPSLKAALKLYQEGKLVESEGAIGMDLSKDKLGFCILIKSDGTGMYATKDIALAYSKFKDYHLDQSIYIVDTRQAYHFKQVFKVLENIGFENHKNCHHLEYDFVELPSGAMASRKGNIIPLRDLIKQMESKIKNDYLNKYNNDWPQDEIDATATKIANGAIKYGMLRMDNNRKIVFEMQEWLKLDGETGPYLQYVHARIHSLCKKLSYSKDNPIEWSNLTTKSESLLSLKLSQFNSIVTSATIQNKPASLCSYLYELGKLFNGFYVECPIGKAENESLKIARLALARATGIIMERGLSLLGIPAPKKM